LKFRQLTPPCDFITNPNRSFFDNLGAQSSPALEGFKTSGNQAFEILAGGALAGAVKQGGADPEELAIEVREAHAERDEVSAALSGA